MTTLLLGATVACATPTTQDRPAQVAETDWIKISEPAGLAVTSASGGKIIGKLYVQRGDKWFEVSVENSPRIVH